MENVQKKIGVDIGGTTIKGALFEGTEVIKEASMPTYGSVGREAIFSSLFQVIEALYVPGVPIGIASAGNIDSERGVCVFATDNLLGWTGTPIAELVSKRYQTVCKADNDAVCALKGELSYYPNAKNVTMLTFGTGVGGASLVNGEVLRGKNFAAARWGHTVINPAGRKCNCGKRGCAEAYLSARSLCLRARRIIPDLTGCEELFARYRAKEEGAVRMIMKFQKELNCLLDNVRNALDPELIILGGGLMGAREDIIKLIEKNADVAFARLGAKAGIYGAASLV